MLFGWIGTRSLLRHSSTRRATSILGSVIKAKESEEFWVWAEAARLYAEDQPGAHRTRVRLPRTGMCSRSKFTVNVHRELAQMFLGKGGFSQAVVSSSRPLTFSGLGTRLGIDKDLQERSAACSWYDHQRQTAENQEEDFYARHSREALVLCFDSVEVRSATYLGVIVPHQQRKAPPGRKMRPEVFCESNGGASVSIVGRRCACLFL